MATPVIFLHGASSAGKSTLARAIQAAAPRPFWHLGLDHLRDGGTLPMARYRAGDFDWATDRARIFAGLHAMLGAVAQTGNPLIVEHILDLPGWIEAMRAALAGCDVLFVRVDCTPAALAAREAARGDRAAGSALRDQAGVHEGLVYDLVLSGADDPAENARTVLRALSHGVRRSAFAGA